MSTVVLELDDIRKSFGGAPALRGARFDVRAGEVHGLVGENGAGKSTLINIATGLYRADSGAMVFGGQRVSFSTTRQAAQAGIAVVHQEADLFAQLSLAENMLLGRGLVRRGPLIDWRATYREAERIVAAMGETFDVMAARFYEDLHAALTEGRPLEVPPAQVRRQIAVMEEAHRQNPLSRLRR